MTLSDKSPCRRCEVASHLSATMYMDEDSSSITDIIPSIRNPSKVRTILVVLVVLLLVVSVVFIVLYANEKNDDSESSADRRQATENGNITTSVPNSVPTTPQTQPCLSSSCVLSAGEILKDLDTSVNPCDDFYRYSCGGFLKKNYFRDDQIYLTAFSNGWEIMLHRLKDLLEKKQLSLSNYLEDSAIYKTISFYQSCMNENEIEASGTKPILDLIEKYGSWDITNTNWSGESWVLERILARVLKDLQTPAFIAPEIGPSYYNTSEYVIWVGPGKVAFERELGELSLGSVSNQLNKIWKGYSKLIKTIFTLLGVDTSAGSSGEKKANDIYSLDALILTLKSSLKEKASTLGYQKIMKYMTLRELNDLTSSKFNWTMYFEEIFRGTNQSVTVDQKLLVVLPGDIKIIIDVITFEPKSLVANAIMWNVVKGLIQSLPKSFREAESEFDKIVSGAKSSISRWKTCVTLTNKLFEYVTALLYADVYFSEKLRTRAKNLVVEIKHQFYDGLEEQSWMDNQTKKEARKKLNAMKKTIGYPAFIEDPTKLNRMYSAYYLRPSGLFQNLLNIYKAIFQQNIETMQNPPDNTRFSVPPVGVNAFYDPGTNSIAVLLGILQAPFYESERLKALNYGGIGMFIGHEITHGFDTSGSQFDDKGNLRMWWTNSSLKNFHTRSDCLKKQYNDTFVFGRRVDGVDTLSENIADNGGLKYAFRAYQKWRDTNGNENRLPSLNYTNDQLFFIGFAQLWCTKYRKETIDLAMADEHALNPVRVRVPLSNFPEFSKAFGCKPPTKTCTVW